MKKTRKTVAVAAAAGLFLSGCNSAPSPIIAPEMPGSVTPSDRTCAAERLGVALLGGSPLADPALPGLANTADRRMQEAACRKAITVANAVMATYFDQGDVSVFTVHREYGKYSERLTAFHKDSNDSTEVLFDTNPDRSEASVREVTLTHVAGTSVTQVVIDRIDNVWHMQADVRKDLAPKGQYVDNAEYVSTTDQLDKTVNQLNSALHEVSLVPLMVPEN